MIRLIRVLLYVAIIVSGVIAGATTGMTMDLALGCLALAFLLEASLTEWDQWVRRRREHDAEVLEYLARLAEENERKETADGRDDAVGG